MRRVAMIPFTRPFPAVVLALSLAACSGDGSMTDGRAGPGEDGLTGATAFTERYATRTERVADPAVDAATLDVLVDALNGFSLELHRASAASRPSESSVSSGYGAATALSLALAGTSGDTRSALSNLLGFDALDEEDVHVGMNALAQSLAGRATEGLVLRTANRVFVRPGLPLDDAYLDVAVGDYGAPVTEADFAGEPEAVVRGVNGWVSEATDGFIDGIVDGFPPGTVLALLNALFLDAGWADEWNDVAALDFTGIDGATSSVPAFGGTARLRTLVGDGVRGVELPYAGDELAMLILVPDDLASFEAALDAPALGVLVDGLGSTRVRLRVPEWADDVTLPLSQLLTPLGLPANPWNFGRMVTDPALADIGVLTLQRARIEVDKDGTRAAAVTLGVGATSVPAEPTVFDVDRPFLYVLRDRTTGTVLFTGRVVAPD